MDPTNDGTASVGRDGGLIITPDLYDAIVEGNIEHFIDNNNDPLERLATPIKNNILHLFIVSLVYQTEKAAEFVELILKICPPLLMQVNDEGDTPLHLAAKFGHFVIVKVLIEVAKAQLEDVESDLGDAKLRMLRKKNKLGNTALHEAVKNYHPDVVKLLTEEDPDYSYSANDSGESLLFIATECGSLRMVDIILENCQSASHEGPDGKTALHMAVISDNLGITIKLLEKKSDLSKATDNNGWTPLHYAAYYGCFSIVQHLLKCDGCVAFVADKERQMTPLHMAAGQGYLNIMEAIISCRPDCCELVDVKGWNFVHFAMAALTYNRLSDLLGIYNSKPKIRTKSLINAKDIEGNTPLHVFAVCEPFLVFRLISRMKKEVRRHALNNENVCIYDTSLYGSPKLQKEIEELKVFGDGPYRKGIIRSKDRHTIDFITRMEKGRDAQLVVAALVATVTFAAALTMPGGFDQEGTSILTKKTAFQAFIIADAVAMVFSLFTVFLHFHITIDLTEYAYMFKYTNFFTIFSILAMVIAFVTGTYAVLTPSLGLAVATTCIGLSFFVLLFGWVVLIYRH